MSRRYYGDPKTIRHTKHEKQVGGTIHRDGEVNVELDQAGKVVAVWFRCQALPFTQSVTDKTRAREMREMYADHPMPGITGLELEDV